MKKKILKISITLLLISTFILTDFLSVGYGIVNAVYEELENQKRALEQLYNEQKVGKTWNKTFTEVYNEYVNHFQGLHKMMFKDMEKLFLGVF